MPSRRPLNDSLLGVAVAAVLVALACWVLDVIDLQVEEHGHNRPFAAHRVIGAERGEGGLARESQQFGGGHAFIFACGSLATPLNSVAG